MSKDAAYLRNLIISKYEEYGSAASPLIQDCVKLYVQADIGVSFHVPSQSQIQSSMQVVKQQCQDFYGAVQSTFGLGESKSSSTKSPSQDPSPSQHTSAFQSNSEEVFTQPAEVKTDRPRWDEHQFLSRCREDFPVSNPREAEVLNALETQTREFGQLMSLFTVPMDQEVVRATVLKFDAVYREFRLHVDAKQRANQVKLQNANIYAQIQVQVELIRELKANKAPKEDVAIAVQKLQALREKFV